MYRLCGDFSMVPQVGHEKDVMSLSLYEVHRSIYTFGLEIVLICT